MAAASWPAEWARREGAARRARAPSNQPPRAREWVRPRGARSGASLAARRASFAARFSAAGSAAASAGALAAAAFAKRRASFAARFSAASSSSVGSAREGASTSLERLPILRCCWSTAVTAAKWNRKKRWL